MRRELVDYMRKKNVGLFVVDGAAFVLEEDKIRSLGRDEDETLLDRVLEYLDNLDEQCTIRDGVMEVKQISPYMLHFKKYYNGVFVFDIFDESRKSARVGTLKVIVEDEWSAWEFHEGMSLEESVGVRRTIDFMKGLNVRGDGVIICHEV